MTKTSGMGAMWLHKRVLAASLIGTAVEFYDFYILSLIHISEPTRPY